MSISDLKETFDKGMDRLLNDLKSLSADLKKLLHQFERKSNKNLSTICSAPPEVPDNQHTTSNNFFIEPVISDNQNSFIKSDEQESMVLRNSMCFESTLKSQNILLAKLYQKEYFCFLQLVSILLITIP